MLCCQQRVSACGNSRCTF